MKLLTIRLIPVTRFLQNEIFDILSDINKRSYPRDPCDSKVIKFSLIKHSLVQIVSNLVESSSQGGIYPESEKLAIVRPKLKYGKDFNTIENYRWLCNVSMISKVLDTTALR